MSDTTYREVLQTAMARRDLSRQQAYDIFSQLMDGRLSDVQTAGLLMGAWAGNDPGL